MTGTRTCIAFEGTRRIAAGSLADVALAVKRAADGSGTAPVLVFDADTSQPIEIDTRGTLDDVRSRLVAEEEANAEAAAPRRPGRPKLGVVGREVTLLPRHWAWLNGQPGGASVALRKLVDKARKDSDGPERKRTAREACYRFMSAMAGDLPNFEEASRALFAGDRDRFDEMVDFWPADIRDHAHTLADPAF
ncbi:DUF2239 family protein [Microbaculum marinum]|uniref:DUF2239 family protein n=1 Tax=Microbaculum marinum TaxID=1764581 RepID=A0AAW9RHT5_9HYPH